MITGAASMLYLLFFYYLDKANLINPFINLGSLLIVVAGMVAACKKVRKQNGDKLERREAIRTSFLVAVLSGLFFYGLMYVLFNFVDPELNEILRAKGVEAGTIKEGIPFTLSLGNLIMGYAFSLIYGFLLAMMVAYFLKKGK